MCCTLVPNTWSCHRCAWQGHPAVLLPCCHMGTSHKSTSCGADASCILLPLQTVTSGTAGAGGCSRTCQQMAMFLCSAYLCWWLLFSPQPTAKPRRDQQDPPNHHPAQKTQSSKARGWKQPQHSASRISQPFSSVHALDVVISSSPSWCCCFWSQPRPGRAEALTKIANKLFNEAFSDSWVWCDFLGKRSGVGFSHPELLPYTGLARLGSARLGLAAPGVWEH